MKKKKVLQISLMGLVLALLLAANGAAVFFYELITVYLGGYGIDTSNIDFTKTSKIAEDIEAEGIILLKNENIDQTTKSLPLSGDEEYKVNVFGWSSIDPAYTGGGSGSSSSLSLATSFYDALEENNISYNTDLVEAYRSYKAGRESTNYWSDQYPYLNLIEPDISYIEPLLDSAYDYSSTALVFITRLGGEHQDLPKTQVKWNSTEDTTRTYLDVTTEEEELIKTVGQKFDNFKTALETSYKNGVTDEFIEPVVLDENGKIKNGDSVIFFNYRSDRAREMTFALTDPEFNEFKT